MTFAEFVGYFNRANRRDNFSTEGLRYLYNLHLASGGGKVDAIAYATEFSEFTARELYEYSSSIREYVDKALEEFEGSVLSEEDLEDAFNSRDVQLYLNTHGLVKLPDSYITNTF